MEYKQDWKECALLLSTDEYSQEKNIESVSLLNMTLNKIGIEVQISQNGTCVNFIKKEECRTKLTRNAGKPRKQIGIFSLSEIEERIQKIGAQKVAEEIGISRATLFRRIREAKMTGDDVIF